MTNKLPRVLVYKQKLVNKPLFNISEEVHHQLNKLGLTSLAGKKIAVALGSRGISNYAFIASAVISWLKKREAEPFIVPAMGSHGGATASGQLQILASYAISEKELKVPILSEMSPVEIPQGNSPVPIFMDQNAYNADGVILVNRVKPHTDFSGFPESGLIKMSVIGLGKEAGAQAIHSHLQNGLSNFIFPAFKEICLQQKILGGLAIVEDGLEQVSLIRSAVPERFEVLERELLSVAKKYLPRLPLHEIDVLVVDEIGKNISGTGMDPNVIGRIGITGLADHEKPRIRRIVGLDLTDASHGNALGVGLADIVTKRLAGKVIPEVTKANVLASGFLERGKMPIIANNDREAIQWAISTSGVQKEKVKLVRIKNTLELELLMLSKAAINAVIKSDNKLQLVSDWLSLCSGDNGLASNFPTRNYE